MSLPIFLGGQFHGKSFEAEFKYKYYGQKKTSVVKKFFKGGFAPISTETVNNNHYLQFHHSDQFYELNLTHLNGAIFSFVHNEKYIVYLAEAKKGSVPFYTAELGEKYKNKRYPVIGVIDKAQVIENYKQSYSVHGKPDKISGIDVIDTFNFGYIPWYLSIHDNHIYFSGLDHSPILLGIVYCPNRPSNIYKMNLSTLKIDQLTDNRTAVRSPYFVPAMNNFIYLENDTMGPHLTSSTLKMENKIILEDNISDSYKAPVFSNSDINLTEFNGIYMDGFHSQCIYKEYCIFDTTSKGRQIIVIVNLNTKELKIIQDKYKSFSYHGHSTGLEKEIAMISSSSYTDGIHLFEVHLEDLVVGKLTINETYYTLPSDYKLNLHSLSPSMNTITIYPKKDSKKIIYMPHGGPHSSYTTAYSHNISAMLDLGYTICFLNYTGSIGFGKWAIDALLGEIGTRDISECVQVIQNCQANEFKGYTPYLMGGSHGGFIAAWIVGQYPDLIKACVMRNPVINLGLNCSSDIMDWAYNEMNLNLKQDKIRFPDAKEYELMSKHSSDRFCKDVKTPTMVMIGKDDLRVPPFQGLRWVQMVNSHNKCAKAIVYEDNGHALDGFEADVFGHEVILEFLNGHQ
eukprot:NODE_12_length_54577_cov_0.384100.p5 type:complete len:626 gc:universal NODE_12_length_54577_cov_0.384100:941-2818(+)